MSALLWSVHVTRSAITALGYYMNTTYARSPVRARAHPTPWVSYDIYTVALLLNFRYENANYSLSYFN